MHNRTAKALSHAIFPPRPSRVVPDGADRRPPGLAGGTIWSAMQTRWPKARRPARARTRVQRRGRDAVARGRDTRPDRLRRDPVAPHSGIARARRRAGRGTGRGVRGWRRGVGGRRPAADRPRGCGGAACDGAHRPARCRERTGRGRRALELAVEDVAAARRQAELRARALARQADLLDRGVGSAAAVEDAELAAATAEQAVLSRRQAEAQAEARATDAETALERPASRWPRRSGNWPRPP
jgi:hypothetical protein